MELRVHGVGGPSAENVLRTREPIPIPGGDASAGFYTRVEPGPAGQKVEAFVWGGLTSGTKLQGAWWLLLPFSLVNLAGWMLRGGKGKAKGHEKAWVSAVWWTRLLLTLGGVLLTVGYLVWSAVALIDVVAFQCGGEAECVNRSWLLPLRWLGGDPVWRITLGGLAVALVALALLFAARRTHRHEQYEPNDLRRSTYAGGRGRLGRNDNLKHPGFWSKSDEWGRLFYWHAYVVVAVLGGIYGYALAAAGAQGFFDERAAPTSGIVWSVIAIVLALTALSTVVGPVRSLTERSKPRFHLEAFFAVTITAGTGGLAGWAWQVITDGGEAPIEGGLGLMTGVWVLYFVEGGLLLFGILPVVTNFFRHFRWGRFRNVRPPKADGWRVLPPAGVVTFALLVANGGFGAVIVRLVDLLDRGDEAAVDIGITSAGLAVDIFFVTLILGLLVLLIPMAGELLPGKKRTDAIKSEYTNVWKMGLLKKIVRFRALSQFGRNVDRMFTTVTLLIIAIFLWTGYRLLNDPFDDLVRPLMGFGGGNVTERIRDTVALAMVLYVFPGAFLVRAGYRSRGTRRQVGKVWESITFFPRRFHPLGAPCYAEKAVPMLRERLRSLANGKSRVVIRAHSQGTVLSYAAISQLIGERETNPNAWVAVREGTEDCQDASDVDDTMPKWDESAELGHVALMTMGSPMGQLHAPFFPNYFCTHRFREVRDYLAGWENYYRETDYIGKALFTDPESILDETGKFEEANASSGEMEGELPPAPDHSIADPREGEDVLHLHSDYPDDRAVTEQIDSFVRAFS